MKNNTKITALIIVGVLCLVAVAGFGSSLLTTTPSGGGGGGGASNTHTHTAGETVVSQHDEYKHSAVIKCKTCEQVITAVYVDHIFGEQGDCLQCGYVCDCDAFDTFDVTFDGHTLTYFCDLCGAERGSVTQPNGSFTIQDDAYGYGGTYNFGIGLEWSDLLADLEDWHYGAFDKFVVDVMYEGRYVVAIAADADYQDCWLLMQDGQPVSAENGIQPPENGATYTLMPVQVNEDKTVNE